MGKFQNFRSKYGSELFGYRNLLDTMPTNNFDQALQISDKTRSY